MNLVPRIFSNAIAEFERKFGEKWSTLKTDVSSVPFENGNFIFYLDNNEQRQMVLTMNNGELIQSGYVMQPSDSWMNLNTLVNTDIFRIKNFQGFRGII